MYTEIGPSSFAFHLSFVGESFMTRWLLPAAALCLFVQPILGRAAEDPLRPEASDYELQRLLVDTITQVERNYVKPIDRRKLIEAAIDGVLKQLDEYSDYVSPEDMASFKTSVSQQFAGIGVQIGVERGQLVLISPLVGTPAYRAGLMAGDQITEIDGKPTKGMRLDEAIGLLKGEAGTSVSLTVSHPARKGTETVALKREIVRIETVLGDQRGDDDQWDYLLDKELRIGYIRVTGFGRNTSDELKTALRELRKRKFAALILDLRFNPGGLLSSAIQISDLFVSEGKIVSTEGRNVAPQVWEAEKRGTYEGFPMVVLVNRYSASASEIVSACLQDHQRAVVVGERTYGKGSVQKVIEMEGGQSALKLTTAGYHRPNGKNIDRPPGAKPEDDWGVKPNDGFELRLSDSELVALLQYRRERDILKPHGQASDSPPSPKGDAREIPSSKPASGGSAGGKDAPAAEAPADRQLQMAVDHLRKTLTQQIAGEGPSEPAATETARDALAEAPAEKMAPAIEPRKPANSQSGVKQADEAAPPDAQNQKPAIDGSQAP